MAALKYVLLVNFAQVVFVSTVVPPGKANAMAFVLTFNPITLTVANVASSVLVA